MKKAYTQINEAVKIANKTEQANQLAKPIASFEKAKSKNTGNATAWLGLAIIYSLDSYTHKDYFKAWNYFTKAEKYLDNISEDDYANIKIYFSAQDVRRRNKKVEQNLEIERSIIEDKLIKYVREENNLDIAKRFIKEYPNSKYYKNVVHIRNYLEFRKAEKENSIAGFSNFVKNYPDAAQVQIANKYIEQLAFQKAKNTKSIDDLNSFILNFPKSDLKFEAVKIRNDMAFNNAREKNSIDAFDSFMTNYPDAIEYIEAKKIKMNLVFQKAKSINTIEAYNEFVSMYPEGEHYIDIFNLKANALGSKILENNKYNTPNIIWAKSFDNKGYDDVAQDFTIFPNNDIFIISTSLKQKQNNQDIWFLSLNKEGKMIWNKEIGDTLNEKLTAIDLISENRFIAVGQNNFNDSVKKAWIISANLDGNKAWSKNFEAEKLNCVNTIINRNIVFGGFYEASDSINKLYLAKIKDNGKINWQRYYSIAGEINDVCKTDSNTIIFTGSNYLINIDMNGYIKWEKSFGDKALISNLTIKYNEGYFTETILDSVFILHKFDLQGNEVWKKTIFDGSIDKITDIEILPNNELLVSSIKEDDIQLDWFNDKGDNLKQESFGTKEKETDCKIKLSSKNTLLLLITIEYSENDSDILVIKKGLQ